jgi:hypothetical protein
MERFEEMKESQVIQCIGANENTTRAGSKNKKDGNPVHIFEERSHDQKNTDFLELPTILRQYIFLGVPGFKKMQHKIVFRWR